MGLQKCLALCLAMESNGYTYYKDPNSIFGEDMDQTGRLYKIDQLLRQHKVISFAALQAALDVSRATLKRDLDDLRTRLKLPIEWSRAAGGYRLASTGEPTASTHELPGLWFSQEELLALITVQQLLGQLEPSLLGAKLKPLQTRLEQLMEKSGLASADVAKPRPCRAECRRHAGFDRCR